MNKILYIVGGTATGKTSLALLLAQKVGGDLISIDSRQVYTGMDIGTGKDIPKNFKKTQQIISSENTQTVYTDGKVRIWGYDQISPDHEYSIALFKKNIDQIIDHIHEQGKLPIIVGGSGLYAKTVENPPPSISIPQNQSLRDKLAKKSVEELQKMVQEISISRFESMNHSDVHNPRRLVRVIEIGNYQKTHPDTSKITTPKFDSLWIGLKTEPKNLEDKITARIEKRIVEGFEAECESLHSQGILRSTHQSGSAIGYAQWLEYESGRLSLKAYKEAWISAEIKYAKRQEVWFKKQENIFWHETENNNFPESVVQKVQVWYS